MQCDNVTVLYYTSKIYQLVFSAMKDCSAIVNSVITYLRVSCCRPLVMFVMENALVLILSQSMRHLRDSTLSQRDKQLLKRELGAELVCSTVYVQLVCSTGMFNWYVQLCMFNWYV